MNIKRAFLTAVASLMLPGYAMAQVISFDTTLELLPEGFDYTQTVMATLTCNTGNPLSQSFEIGPTTEDKVVFVVDNFDLDEFIQCEITASTASGFISLGTLTNGATNGNTCLYTAADQNLITEGVNTCVFQLAPEPFSFTISKVWEIEENDDNDVSLEADVDWTCYNVITGPNDSSLYTLSDDVTLYGNDSETIGGEIGFHPSPDGNTYCTADEDVVDSAVESDQGCSSSFSLTIGDNENGCTITNTVFFEVIPTLSQYGLAIMALLMLGVGFVGFRRFV